MSSSTVTPVLCCRRPLRRQKGDPCPGTHPTCPQHSVTSESLRQRPPAAESIPKTPPSSHPVTGELSINTHQKLGSFYWSLSLFLILHRIISFIGNRRKKPKFSKPHAAERTTLIAFIFKQIPIPASDDASTIWSLMHVCMALCWQTTWLLYLCNLHYSHGSLGRGRPTYVNYWVAL